MGEDIERVSYFKKNKKKNTSILREETKDTRESQIKLRKKKKHNSSNIKYNAWD